MVKRIDYLHCVCDMCGADDNIASTASLPTLWSKVGVGRAYYDLCNRCVAKVDEFIRNYKEEGDSDGSEDSESCRC